MNISSPPIAQRAEQKLQNHEVFYAGLVVIVLKLHSWDILQRLSEWRFYRKWPSYSLSSMFPQRFSTCNRQVTLQSELDLDPSGLLVG